MKLIKFNVNEIDTCFSALSYMFTDNAARKEYKNLLLDVKAEFPSNDLNIMSDILINCNSNDNDILSDRAIAEQLFKINKLSDITDYSSEVISKTRFHTFIDKIKGNIDTTADIQLFKLSDNKQAFMSYINGNLRALINSTDKNKFAYWNSKAWELLSEEKAYIIYGNFIKQCNLEIKQYIGSMDKEEISKLSQKINKWDTDRNARECMNKVKRDINHTIDLETYNKDLNLICSHDGKVINLSTGDIKEANRNDMILYTSKYNLMGKNESIEFMSKKLELYNDVLGSERLNFLLDFISYKMLGKNLQTALFLIGTGGTGKSLFKNIVKDLFETDVVDVPYEYYTQSHSGNDDKSRDDILVSLNNKLLGLSSEGNDTDDYTINQARFKRILSNSTESARATRGTMTEVNLKRLDLLIDTNDIPRFKNVDYAISRRLLFVNFTNRIPLDKVNSNYYDEEIRSNFDYVFSYFVYRAIGLIGKKLIIPQCIKNDTDSNIEEFDSVAKFARTQLAAMPGVWTKFEDVRKAYEQFCNDEDMTNIIADYSVEGRACSAFIKALKEKPGYEQIWSKRRGNGPYIKSYFINGVCLLDNSNCPFDNDSEETPVKKQSQEQLKNDITIQQQQQVMSWNI